ncbi:hypothetical protein LRS74_28950 [Streptomyces sp. LX-29]|uniref:hypothetical protein n=1 Tax=Streptomyces sp. LX-29 TaxID=2900152 RepID=UPI00240E047C|nr:hypothetical protein [Streptomyces sp. LX-29]WFB10615.1 hypothetical protein LRS74_28950 [Streptomyces sp. LX-29]
MSCFEALADVDDRGGVEDRGAAGDFEDRGAPGVDGCDDREDREDCEDFGICEVMPVIVALDFKPT